MLTLYQRLIFGYVLLLSLVLAVGLHDSLSLHQAAALDHQASVSTASAAQVRAGLARRATTITTVCTLSGVLITIGFLISIIRPIRRTAAAARRIGQGELQQRIEWRTRDDLGTIATELNRMAVRLRDLRDTEYGRKQMDQQLSDAVVQSIFEPVIVTDAKGHVLKLNQAAKEVLGEAAADRMALTNTPGGERILRAVRDAVSMRQSIATEGEAVMLPMKLGEGQRSYRLRTTPMRDAEGKLLGAVSVLEDITLALPDRGLFALCGPNGAGKSTLLNVIGGSVPPSNGQVILSGVDITRRPPHERFYQGISRTFQSVHLIKGRTVLDNVAVACLASHKASIATRIGRSRLAEARAQASRALADLGMAHLAGREVSSLTLETQRMVELARALAPNPRLLLLDEPASGLSEEQRQRLAGVLAAVATRTCVFLVEHDLALVAQVSERIFVLAAGRLVFDGGPEHFRSSPVVNTLLVGS